MSVILFKQKHNGSFVDVVVEYNFSDLGHV